MRSHRMQYGRAACSQPDISESSLTGLWSSGRFEAIHHRSLNAARVTVFDPDRMLFVERAVPCAGGKRQL